MTVKNSLHDEAPFVDGGAPFPEAYDKKSEKKEEAIALPMEEEKPGDVEARENTGSEHPVTSTPVTPPPKERHIFGIKWILIVLAIYSNLLFYAIDNTIVAVIQPVIVRQFGNVQNLPWISVGFLVAGTATALINGKLFGAFNAKHLYISFSLIFLVGSVVCGVARNLPTLIVGRIIGGIGGTGMYLGALTLISVNTSAKETSEYMGYLALVWGFGSVIGPLIGGAFVESKATWRWGFYINAPVIGLFVPIYLYLVPSYNPQPTSGFSTKILQIDWIGALLSSAAFVTGIMSINFGGTLYDWNSGRIIALFVVSGSCFLALFLQQYYCIKTTSALRVLPIHLLKVKDMILCFVCQVAVALIVPVPLYYLPIFFQFAKGDSALRAGIKTLPLIATWVTSSAFRGKMMGKLGWYQPWYILGSILNILAGLFLSRINIHTSNAVIYGLEILSGIGTECYRQAGFAVAQQLAPPTDIHHSISLMLIAQLTGTTLGLALAGAIFQNVSLIHIRAILPGLSTAQLSRIITDAASISEIEIDEAQRTRVLHSLATASADTYILIYAAAGLSLLCSISFTPRKLW